MKVTLNRAYEMVSAMQKCVRRSKLNDAGFWFFGLCEGGFTAMALHRLRVTCHEDIGYNDWTSALYALKCIDDAEAMLKAKKMGWRNAAANALMALCAARKNRAADHFQCACRGRFLSNPEKAVPDFALDKHTRRGKSMKRGFDHFRQVGAKLSPNYNKQDEWEDEAYGYWKSGIFDQKKDKSPEPADMEPQEQKSFLQ